MTVFPLFENIDQKTFLIIGGGDVARRKVDRLLQFTNRIIVIAEETAIPQEGGIRILRRPFSLEDLSLGDFVIAATDERNVNRSIADYCREHRIPVNVVDDPSLCSFLFPSIVKRGDLTVGISTGGSSPAYAQHLRKEIEKILPDHIGGILETMGKLRAIVPKRIPDQQNRSRCYREILSLLLETDGAASQEEMDTIIRRHSSHRLSGNAADNATGNGDAS